MFIYIMFYVLWQKKAIYWFVINNNYGAEITKFLQTRKMLSARCRMQKFCKKKNLKCMKHEIVIFEQNEYGYDDA